MDDKNLASSAQDDPQTVTTTNKRTQNSTPTVYPSVDFVNRTEP